MNILEQIIAQKQQEVAASKKETGLAALEKLRYFDRPVRSLCEAIKNRAKTGIIAEFKRRSPSKGVINNRDSVESVTRMYTAYGASALSVLTDASFFGGSLDDLLAARDNDLPILRKDFMIDEYQLVEAKAHGADAILLIAACLSPQRVKELATAAKKLGLEVLLELHGEEELEHICEEIDLVGVNNRNLKTFSVDLEQSVRLSEKIGKNKLRIAESGINHVDDVHYLKENGFDGFLIGEYFMRQEDPGRAFKEFSYAL
ncbi:MAG TPA: indole-3-glycerol phosphate synthase TrpC [Flavisolibacter sp.]|nr:indole-3-glycerol phosphate synthase TrpC [Flavisolibacter sp.]